MNKHSWNGYILKCQSCNYIQAMNSSDFTYVGVCSKGYTLFKCNGIYYAAK